MIGFAGLAAVWIAIVAALPIVTDPVSSGARDVDEIAAEDAPGIPRVEGREPTPSEEVPVSERTASDRGVTSEAIRLDILSPDPSFLGSSGVELGGRTMPDIVQPFLDEVNASGGINGRRVEAGFIQFNPASADALQAACVEATEDHKVFAALATTGLYGSGEVCMGDHETPLITQNIPDAQTLYERDGGWVRSTAMNADRAARNLVEWMVEDGVVDKDTKVGLISEGTGSVPDTVVEALEADGIDDIEVGVLEGTSADSLIAGAQRVVGRFQSTGVEVVLPMHGFIQIFIALNQAESLGYHPVYVASDVGGVASSSASIYPPEQWAGTQGVTAAITGDQSGTGVPNTPEAEECEAIYNKAGLELPEVDNSNENFANSNVEAGFMLTMCEQLALFTDVARRAGDNPTRASFLEAFDETGTWTHRVVSAPALTFNEDKYDGADMHTVVQWQEDCACYRRMEPFRESAP